MSSQSYDMEPNASPQAYTSMMRFTLDGRPYVKDIHDLFAALIIQTPIDTHRYLFRNYYNTFSSEDAIQGLASLRFSHTLRTPDPNDPSKQVRTITTTTFKMAREMAKALCQHFNNARLMENAVDTNIKTFRDKGLWHLTPKGLCVLQDFCLRTEVPVTATLQRHFSDMSPISLLKIERHEDDDQLVLGRQSVSIIFRAMMATLPIEGNLERNHACSSTPARKKSSSTSPPPSSGSSATTSSSSATPSTTAPFAMASQGSNGDSRVQLMGNYLLTLSKAAQEASQIQEANTLRLVFSTQMCCDWLLDRTTLLSREEGETIVHEFLRYEWIEYQDPKHASTFIKYSKSIMLVVTAKGRALVADDLLLYKAKVSSLTAALSTSPSLHDDSQATLEEMLSQGPGIMTFPLLSMDTLLTEPPLSPVKSSRLVDMDRVQSRTKGTRVRVGDANQPRQSVHQDRHQCDPKESNYARLTMILNDPPLRSLFKDFLRANFCEENLDFWIDYSTLRRKCRSQSPVMPSQNQRELLEDAYSVWSTYLSPGAPSELNIEHTLRQEMARLVNAMVTINPSHTQASSTYIISTPSVSQSLKMMLKWFDRVEDHITRLMAADSVPKFVKTEGYRNIMEARDTEHCEPGSQASSIVPNVEIQTHPLTM